MISLKYGYLVIQIRSTMHYGIDLLTFKEENKYELIKGKHLKVASLVSLEYKGSNVGILVSCYHATIDLRGSI